jgi:hypothetical protein
VYILGPAQIIAEFAETFVECGMAGFVVGSVGDRAGGRFEAKAEATLRMIEPACGNLVLTNTKRFSAGSRNLRRALMAEKSIGKYGKAICVSKT